MKTILTSFLLILASSLFGIQIRGKVSDADTDAGIPNALIISQSSLGQIDSLYSDSLGFFNLKISKKGAFKITAQDQLNPPKYKRSKVKIIDLHRRFSAPSSINFKLLPVD